MIKLPEKMSPKELAALLDVTPQAVNRWIQQKGWPTEPMPGVKGGRARLILMTPAVVADIANMPAFRHKAMEYQMEEPARSYSAKESEVVWRQIADVLQNMTPVEQQRLQQLLVREGICGFLSRLGLSGDK